MAAKWIFDVAQAPDARDLLAHLRKFRGTLPAYFS